MVIENGTFILKEGRTIGFSQYGADQGYPVLFFHGTPNSRKTSFPDLSILEKLNVRLITLERPGYGLSDVLDGRTVIDWADDVCEFVEYHGFKQFSVAGVSGGGPYALSCAYKMPDKVRSCGIISGFAPINNNKELRKKMSISHRIAFGMALKSPRLLKTFLKPVAKAAIKNPEKSLDKFMTSFAKSDQQLVKSPKVRQLFINDMKEAYRQGIGGHYGDLVTLVKPWGFSLNEIDSKVYIWQGQEDKNVPLVMGEYLDEGLNNSETTIYKKEGHLLFFKRWNNIITALVPDGNLHKS
ncbi:alpha/beta hydrolase [Filobacillus milosensis]|uniref:Alpha/beta hydrolase n=1 Tax=Filobacillus milosensis TaxID=94137 RepID=A0A4Y8IDU4_9BACI|nr:alpha/beta hydrolase [Filobacillus milosensis]TFB14116.1 alpha/beta hydrolase [Filobacillus milosensis]